MDGSIATSARPALSVYLKQLLGELDEIFVQRGASYSDFDDNSRICQNVGRALAGINPPMIASDTTVNGVEMIRHKLSRLATTGWSHRDSWIDLAGYALLIAASQQRAQDVQTSSLTSWEEHRRHIVQAVMAGRNDVVTGGEG